MSNFLRFNSTLMLLSFSMLNAFSLNQGYKLALENDMDYKVNQNNLKNIKFDQDIAQALLYPKVDLSAKAEITKLTQDRLTPGESSHIKKDEYELTFSQPVFDGNEYKNEDNLQKERFKSAVYFIKETKEDVALSYSQAYLNTLREKDLLSLSKESLSISEDIFNKVFKKVESGYGTKLEFEEAKGNFAEDRVKLDVQRINLKESIENLKLYVQSDFDTSELDKPKFVNNFPENLTNALDVAMKYNPSINVARTNVNVAMYEEKKTQKEFYPDVNLIGSYKLNNALYSEDDEEYNEYKLGFEVKYNLYNGGRDQAAAKKALQNIRDKELLIKKNQYQVKNAIRVAWNRYKLNKEKRDSLEQFLIVKKDVLDAMIKEFDLGLKDLNTLQETHVEYIDVKKDLIRNTYDILSAQYTLLNSMGRLSEVLEEKLPTLKKIDSTKLVKKVFEDNSYSFNKGLGLEEKKLEVITPEKVKNVAFVDEEKTLTLKTKKETPIVKNIALQEEIVVKPVVKEDKEFLSFKEKFLNAQKNKYTINLAHSDSAKKAQKLLDRYNLNKDAFFFSFRNTNPLQRIVYGVYDSRSAAKKALNALHKNLKRNKPIIERVSIKQKVYYKYHDKDIAKKQEKIIVAEPAYKALIKRASFSNIEVKKQVKKPIETLPYNNFKDKFLNATKDKYTINIAYSDSKKKAKALLDKYNLSEDGFIFQFRKRNPLQRIVYGVFDSKKEAMAVLATFDKRLMKNRPVIEKITIKQNMYHKYNTYTKPSTLGSI